MSPSAPALSNEVFHDYRTFEAVRRPTVGGRRCSPMANSYVAVDRVIAHGRPALLVRRAHACSPTRAIAMDTLGSQLHAVGLAPLDAFSDADGHINVVLDECPGVRLRALVEACVARGRPLAEEVVWHLVERSRTLREVWERVGLVPVDTFVGFDGSLHLFPDFEQCRTSEQASWVGDEIWDVLLADDTSQGIAALVCGQLPQPFFEDIRRRDGDVVPLPEVPAAARELLARPRTRGDATEQLGALARELFPETFQRHEAIYQSLGLTVGSQGRQREATIRAVAARETYPTALRLVEPPPPRDSSGDHLPPVALAMESTSVTVGQLRRFLRARGEAPWFADELPDATLATGVPYAVAEAYARSIDRRLPTQNEWMRAQAIHGAGLWEWTSTVRDGNRIVCRGGEWRAVKDPRSQPANAGGVLANVSFRCVMDIW